MAKVQESTFDATIRRGDGYDAETYTYIPVVVVGAGESGIAMACRMKEKLGFDQFRIYDRQSGIGGTWWINRYPGVACDVPATFYSFSFCPNPRWTALYPKGPEIVEYLQSVCEKYQIIDKIQLNTDVTECTWNDAEGLWDIVVRHLMTGVGDLSTYDKQQKLQNEGVAAVYTREERIKAKVLISCVGGLVEPKQWPDRIPGREKFKGEIFHSARWRYDVDLQHKNVVVVGTGCSAAQFVPRLRKDYGAKSITQICRSPPWVVPKLQLPVSSERIVWLNSNVPGYQKLFRMMIAGLGEYDWRWFGSSDYAAKERKTQEEILIKHLQKHVPQKYWEILTPNYALGCKRRIFDAEWFPSLQDPGIELTTLPLTAVHEDSVTLGPGRTYPDMKVKDSHAPTDERTVPADVIILANGFETTKWLHPLELHGRGGKTLHEVYDERGGAQMYMGTAMDDFPNFFVIFGPNTATGHSSVILASENMVEMVLKFIGPIIAGDVSRTEVKKEAEMDFTADIQRQLKKTVWHMGGCNSWYKDATDWNSTVYPYSQIHFGYKCMFPTWSDWIITYTEQGRKKNRRRAALRYLGYGIALVGVFRLRKAGHKIGDIPALFRVYLRGILLTLAGLLQGVITKF